MNLFEKVMIRLIQLLGSLFVSIFLVIVSLGNPVMVHNQAEMRQVALGLPLSFLEQDLSRLDIKLPTDLGMHSPLEYPFEVMWPNLIINVLFVSLVVYASPYLVRKLVSIVLARLQVQPKTNSSQETDSPIDIKGENEKVRETGI